MSRPLSSPTLFLGLFLAVAWLAGCGSPPEPARVRAPEGKVQTRVDAAATFADARDHDPVREGGAVRTGEDGRARLVFPDGSELAVRSDTFFEVGQGASFGRHHEGTVLYKIQKQRSGLTVETPHAITSVLGTTFLAIVGTDSTLIGVEEGRVAVTPRAGGAPVTLEAKQKLTLGPTGPLGATEPFDLATEEFSYLKIDGKWVKPK